jgi:hypothetical protein
VITKDYLKSLSPCEDRYKHYLQFYKDWSGTLEEFLDLPELTHNDKKWVFVCSIDNDKLRLVAADFAERVLHIYESKYPNDDRPRKAIEAARSGTAAARAAFVAADAYVAEAADDAYAARAAFVAAYAARAASADAASAASASAAARAANAAAYAARADAYSAASAAADAAYAAADAYDAEAADDAADAYDAARAADAAYAAARVDEEKAQLEIMKRYAREALKEIT